MKILEDYAKKLHNLKPTYYRSNTIFIYILQLCYQNILCMQNTWNWNCSFFMKHKNIHSLLYSVTLPLTFTVAFSDSLLEPKSLIAITHTVNVSPFLTKLDGKSFDRDRELCNIKTKSVWVKDWKHISRPWLAIFQADRGGPSDKEYHPWIHYNFGLIVKLT